MADKWARAGTDRSEIATFDHLSVSNGRPRMARAGCGSPRRIMPKPRRVPFFSAMSRIDPGELATLLLTAPLGARIGLATHSETARQAAARALAVRAARWRDGGRPQPAAIADLGPALRKMAVSDR